MTKRGPLPHKEPRPPLPSHGHGLEDLMLVCQSGSPENQPMGSVFTEGARKLEILGKGSSWKSGAWTLQSEGGTPSPSRDLAV